MYERVIGKPKYRRFVFSPAVSAVFLLAISNTAPTRAQSPEPAPATPPAALAFEAATIKLVKEPSPGNIQDRTNGRHYTTRYTTLRNLIMFAYGLDPRQVIGGPEWIATDEYDIDAVAPEGVPVAGNWESMLRKLLADRFQLAFHYEQRELNVYALTIAKGGPKLKPTDPAEPDNLGCSHFGACSFQNEPLRHFAYWLQLVMDRPVVDKTGLKENFDFSLNWTPDESQFTSMGIRVPSPAGSDPNAPPGLFTALQEQLGLKLEPQKTQAQMLVIDRAERPSEN